MINFSIRSKMKILKNSVNEYCYNKSPKISYKTSVIITSHNYGRFLGSAIDSALGQTVKPKEVIVIDDASEDNTEEIAKSFGNKIRYFKVNFRNVSKTRNFGLSVASGEYVVFLDADDYFRGDFLEKTQHVIQKSLRIKLVYSDRIHVGFENLLENRNQSINWNSQRFDYKSLQKDNFISLPSLIRKNGFKGFDENIKGLEDWEAWLNFLRPDSAIWIREPLFFVRIHEQNKSIFENRSIERLKILFKHGILKDNGFDMLEVISENMPRKKNPIINLIVLRGSDNIGDVTMLLEKMKKSDRHYFYYILEESAEDNKNVIQMEKLLSEYGFEHRISKSMNPDQLLYSFRRNENLSIYDLKSIHVINKSKKMLELLEGENKYFERNIFISGRNDLLGCQSIDELDILFLNKKGVRIFYKLDA